MLLARAEEFSTKSWLSGEWIEPEEDNGDIEDVAPNEATLLEKISEDFLPKEDNVAASSIGILDLKNFFETENWRFADY